MIAQKVYIKKEMWQFIKFFLTIFIIILIPMYWHYYGIQNFLWLSDIGLFLTISALWLNSSLLMSMAAVGVLLVELAWNIDFFAQLIFNINIIDVSSYMFDTSYPMMLRALSLFHILMPFIWISYLSQYGYDKRAFNYFTILYWIVLFCTYLFTAPAKNINWVFLPQIYPIYLLQNLSLHVWIIILFIGFPLCIFLPTHYIYAKFFKTIHKKN